MKIPVSRRIEDLLTEQFGLGFDKEPASSDDLSYLPAFVYRCMGPYEPLSQQGYVMLCARTCYQEGAESVWFFLHDYTKRRMLQAVMLGELRKIRSAHVSRYSWVDGFTRTHAGPPVQYEHY